MRMFTRHRVVHGKQTAGGLTPKRRGRSSSGSRRTGVRSTLLVPMALAGLILTASACGDSDPPVPSESTVAGESTAGSEPTMAGEPTTGIESTFVSYGNPDSKVVVLNTQGGPLPELLPEAEITGILGDLDLANVHLVNVHQEQTLKPDDFVQPITFDEAKAASSRSVDLLADAVDHFQAQDKAVYVFGYSFGAFMGAELLATQGPVADGYLLASGRLDMNEEAWRAFAEGEDAVFDKNGVDVIVDGKGDPATANFRLLAAGLGFNRYTERLRETDLSSLVYIYGKTDDGVGRLLEEEVAFLKEQGASVVGHEGGHELPPEVLRGALERVVGEQSLLAG